MDALHHINHAAYLIYMESARVDYYNNFGFDLNRWDLEESTILASMRVDYFRQAHHPAVLEVGHRISRTGTKSFDILTSIFETGHDPPLVIATFTIVAFNYQRQATIPVPEPILKACRPL